MAKQEKARYWAGVLYQESMVDDWETVIGDALEYPYAYAAHTLDVDSKSEHRKDHVHVVIAYGSPVARDVIMRLMNKLSKDGTHCCNTVEAVRNVRHMYDYLIHDTDTCRKQGKYQYDKSVRVTGNGFDIGSYEQVSVAEKDAMAKELCDVIIQQGFTNFVDFYMYSVTNFDTKYFEVIKTYSGLFERLTKGNFQRNMNQ